MAVKKKRTKAQRSAAAKASWERRRAATAGPLDPAFTVTIKAKEGYSMPVLTEREQTHGDFQYTAKVARAIKDVCRTSDGEKYFPQEAEAIDLIATKLARITSGNAHEREHWLDIAGYATLIADRLKG